MICWRSLVARPNTGSNQGAARSALDCGGLTPPLLGHAPTPRNDSHAHPASHPRFDATMRGGQNAQS